MYNNIIRLYAFAVKLAAPFKKKAAKIISGQRNTLSILSEKIIPGAKYIWFHAASSGEFEQGRPLIEKIRKEKPEYRILLTFFSPSGYEMRKDYEGADIVCYLPFDKPELVEKFLDAANPAIAIFIKYEFWKNYINSLKRRRIPTYIISAIFRPNQIFFRPYGRHYGRVLEKFDWLFVQDENSRILLEKYNIRNVSVSGDTRFDRVYEIFEKRKEIPVVERFLKRNDDVQRLVLIAGSTWEKDEELLIPFFNAHPEYLFIIAPHEMGKGRVERLLEQIKRPAIRYSEAESGQTQQADCLIIDNFGLLSSIYRYADVAYVGGGFGVGIHNILEAAVYGVPVLFGPNHKKAREADGLIEAGGGAAVATAGELAAILNNYSAYKNLLAANGQNSGDYVVKNLGATDRIYAKLFGL
ncbi:MAG: 3-deoxy-D-manno-octulosonic acid transferase [Dysgonamonadaceae bacterium]|nr:3-deoxy-D-manno-octulosonic acid transferase [Dysgonamonadaceae bacterium]